IKTLDDLLIEIEELINKHDNTEIYNFKKLLKEEFKMVYRGNLPVPETGDPGSDPKDPLPSKDPSDENEDEGTTGDDKGDKNDDKSPNVTPKPEEVEESDDKLPGTVTFTDIENHWAKENIIGL